ncbi:MAG: methyltransferase domain-containing protein [Chloroflexi bacterium]|nr:methyltransferase domain-containing protein [Chloroflexota bacterium]
MTSQYKPSMKKYAWRELIARLKLAGNEDVLDLGCGDGKVSAEIAGYVPGGSVLGVDNSEEMIALAGQKHSRAEHPNLSFLWMDAAKLSFEGQFDVVFSNAALHWIRDHQPVLRGIYRSLRPGGHILLQMGGKGNTAQILSVLEEMQAQEEWQAYFRDFAFPYGFYGPEDYTRWLYEAGFEIQRVELIPKDMQPAGQSGLEGWLRTTWLPYTQRVPEGKREAFIAELAGKYLRSSGQAPGGVVHVAMMRLEVQASRIH